MFAAEHDQHYLQVDSMLRTRVAFPLKMGTTPLDIEHCPKTGVIELVAGG